MSWALAHQPGLSFARVEGDDLVLTFSATELDGHISIGQPNAREVITAFTLGKTELRTPDGPCRFGGASVQRVEADGLEVRTPVRCPSALRTEGTTWTLRGDFLAALRPGHRTVVEVDGAALGAIDAGQPEISFLGAPGLGATLGLFGGLGVEHILTGYDHLAFVAGLLLGARAWREIVWLVTTFTVAHSLTLGAATLGLVTLSPSFVEPAIAASIAFVGLENLVSPPFRRRVALTFAFGLVHGLGFAGLLTELGVGRANLPVALLAFNVGVEAGQVACVALASAALWRVRQTAAWTQQVAPALNVGVAVAGLWWLAERLGWIGG
jgi:hydrogenase/urease accessory protein HupE